MPNYLADIVAAHRAGAARDERDVDELIAEAVRMPAGRGFLEAITGHEGLAVIAEIKRRSPSKGDLDPDLDPAAVGADYESGGATCLSVLTDGPGFGGSPDDLQAARGACGLPVLRKDFTVSRPDVCDAKLMGADAVLLIVAALTDAELIEMLGLAAVFGLAALVEVADDTELDRALDCGARLIGINQRDLVTFEVNRRRAEEMVAGLPSYVVAVAESGIQDAEDAQRLAAAGYQAVLVGESLVRSADRVGAVKALVGYPVGSRRLDAPAPA